MQQLCVLCHAGLRGVPGASKPRLTIHLHQKSALTPWSTLTVPVVIFLVLNGGDGK